MYLLVLIIILIVRSIIYFVKNEKLPGPVPIPIIGHLHYLMLMIRSKDCLPLFRRFKDVYGDYFLVYVFHVPYLILNHPKHLEPLLSSMDFIRKGRNYLHLQSWLGDGLLTSTGERWKMHRKFLTPAFHFNMLQNFLPVFLKNEKILIRKLKEMADGRPVNLFPIISLTALDNVTGERLLTLTMEQSDPEPGPDAIEEPQYDAEKSIMGVPVNAQMQSESEYVKSIETISSLVSKKMRIPILGWSIIFNLTPYKKMEKKALKVLHAQSLQVIEKRIEELKNKNTLQTDSTELGIKNKHAFLDLLLLSEINGQKINIQHIREEVDTFMFEGHDTTTSTISFGLYCISKSQEIQQKILDEQKLILQDDLNRNPSYNELQQMKYLEMVIKESLRLYPSVPLIERTVTKDCKLSGIPIKKGTSVIVNIFEVQRHPDLFEDPLVFRPERFAGASNNAFSWLAFSAGPRNCIGQKFAIMEMKVIISAVVKSFALHPVSEQPVLCADLILRSENGIKVALTKRD